MERHYMLKELKRKMFHMTSLIFPMSYLFLSKAQIVTSLLIITVITVLLDVARHYNKQIQDIVEIFFSPIMRDHEKSGQYQLSGCSYMLIGFLITGMFFSKPVAVASWLVLIISDSCAAIFGRHIGRPSKSGKSFEGSCAFFLSAMLLSIIVFLLEKYPTNFWVIVTTCLATTYVEYYSKRLGLDDNLTIPTSFAAVITLLEMAFF